MTPYNRTKSLPFSQYGLTAASLPAIGSTAAFLYPRGMSGMGDWLSDIIGSVTTGGTDAIDQTVQTAITQGQTALGQSMSSADPVPVQNSFNYNILAPVSAALQNPAVLNSIATLQALAVFLNNGYQAWHSWLQAHPSSRATEAQQTLDPYFIRASSSIQAALTKLGAVSPVVPGTNIPVATGLFSNMSTSTMILGAVALWFFLRR